MRRVAQVAVWALALLAATSIVAIATSGATDRETPLAEDEGLPVRLPATPGMPAPPDPGAPHAARATGRVPAPQADVAESLALAKNDVVLRKILGSTTYRVVGSEPWTTGELEPLGTKLDIALDAPISGAFRLPAAEFNPSGSSYHPIFLQATIAGATTLTLLVDLQSGRIASVIPPPATVSELEPASLATRG